MGEAYDVKSMVLSASEKSLIRIVRTLAPEEAGKILDWAEQLTDLGSDRSADWSDSWSDQDLADATAAAVRRFEQQEREEG